MTAAPTPERPAGDPPLHAAAPSAGDAAFLAEMPLFDGLSPAQIQTVLDISRPATVAAGTAVVREGERGDAMFVLMEGRVEVSRHLTLRMAGGGVGEGEKSFTRLDAQNKVLFGEMALLEQSERAATVVALTECRLLVIEHQAFETLCRADPMLGQLVFRNMARQLSSRLRQTNQNVLKLTTALSLALGSR